MIYSSAQKKILLLEGIHPLAQATLEEYGYQVSRLTSAYQGEELIERAKGFDAIGIRSKTQLTKKVLESCSSLQAIGAFCIGTNQIDLTQTEKAGLPVFNAPYSNTRSVAELVICEMIALSRHLSDVSAYAHKGVWKKSAQGSFEVRGKKLGIVGYGHIGSQLSILAESLGVKVYYYDIIKKLPLGNAKMIGSLEKLFSMSDFVSFHVPETDLTHGMVGEHELSKMKQGSFLINASRGSVIKINELIPFLKSKHLAGAAIDVFPEEPANNDQIFKSELQSLDNVILTPHIGGSTEEAQRSIGLEVAESLHHFFASGQTDGGVSFPKVNPAPLKEGSVRLLNVHQNVPGVLGEINRLVSLDGINIENQYLSTNSEVGYLVMDFIGDVSDLANKINALKTSIWTRVIEN